MFRRIFYLLTCGVVLAGIIHIIIILMIPVLGSRDAARQIMATTPSLQFTEVNTADRQFISSADPFFDTMVCRFDVGENGIFVSAEQTENFWSASIYNEQGEVIYSVNDRTAIGNQLRLLIVSPVQMAAIRQLQPDELETSIVVETSTTQGFLLLRSLVREPSLKPESDSFLKTANCSPYEAI